MVVSYVVCLVTSYIFITCEPGMMLTAEFEKIGNELCRCNWYLLPADLQRMLIIFVLDMQNPIKISSYANITCERDTAKLVYDYVQSN